MLGPMDRPTQVTPPPSAHAAGGTSPSIGPGGAFSIGIGGIVGGGIFATLGLAAAEAGGAAWISFAVGAVLALLTAYSYTRLSVTFPDRGGTVAFLDRAFGSGVRSGGVSTMLVLSYVVILALYAAAFASYVVTLLPADMRDSAQTDLALGIIVVLALVNFAGPRLVTSTEGIFNAGKLGILAIFVVVGFAGGTIDADRLSPETWPGPMAIVSAGMLVFLSYEGFELIANASDRVRDPGRTLPLAFFGSVAVAAILYVLIVIVTTGSLSPAELAAAQANVLTAAGEAVMGPPGAVLLAVGAILATASAINADYFGASKLPVVLAEQDEAPTVADREVWGRHPVGLVLIMVLALAFTAFLDLHALSAAASAGFIAVFAVVNVANAKLAERTGSRRSISIVGAVACVAALVVLVADLLGQPAHGPEVIVIAALLILPFGYQWLYQRLVVARRPAAS
jgi:amino acid transporter